MLFTGLFGGAMATHLRAESPMFSHGRFMWGGLWLRDERLRALFAWRRGGPA